MTRCTFARWWKRRKRSTNSNCRLPVPARGPRRPLRLEPLEARLPLAGLLVSGAPAWEAPLVRVYDAETLQEQYSIEAFEPRMHGGVRVAVGDVNADGTDDVIAAAGGWRGFGRVRVFDGSTGERMDGPLGEIRAFGNSYIGGAFVAAGDVNRDGYADIIVGADGYSQWRAMQEVRVFSGEDGALLDSLEVGPVGPEGRPFRRWDWHYGQTLGSVRVAAGDINSDGRADVIAAIGSGRVQHVEVHSLGGDDIGRLARKELPYGGWNQMAFVAAADLDSDTADEVLVSTPSGVTAYTLDGNQLQMSESFATLGRYSRSVPIAAVDINADDRADIVTSRPRGDLRIADERTFLQAAQLSVPDVHWYTASFVAGTGRDSVNPLLRSADVQQDVLDRLGRFDPSDGSFKTVTAGDSVFNGKNVYFIAHGWAPDWKPAVTQYAKDHQDDFLKWWQTTDADLPKRPDSFPASAWMFDATTTTVDFETFTVSQFGLAKSITEVDPNAIVAAYSWIDQSATDSEKQGYASEAYTYLNGRRLAQAVELALGPVTAQTGFAGRIHLAGHSHGAKVATIATAILQEAGYPVWHLTTFDSPDSLDSDRDDATNFTWFYLPEIDIGRDPANQAGTTFVDNYVSEFGNRYDTFPGLTEVVDVHLCPAVLYFDVEPGAKHSYSAAWYGGASRNVPLLGDPTLGLHWSPLLDPARAAKLAAWSKQTWKTAEQSTQFILDVEDQNAPTMPTQAPVYSNLPLKDATSTGSASYDTTTGVVTLNEKAGKFNSSLTGTAEIDDETVGIAFDFEWTNPGDGDQLTISIGGYDGAYELFKLTGVEAGTSKQSATLSASDFFSVWGSPITFALSGTGNENASVQISNLRQFSISGTSVSPG